MNNETFGMTFQYSICLHFKIENDISLFVVNGYLNILFAKENLNAAKVQHEISKKQIEAAESRFNSGVIPKGDLLNQTI